MKKIEGVQKLLSEHTLDALLITNHKNIYYLTDFLSLAPEDREAYVVVTRKNIYFLTHGLCFTEELKNNMSKQNITAKKIDREHTILYHLQEIITSEKIEVIGFEDSDLKYNEYEIFHKHLSHVRFIPTKNIISSLRIIKTKDEILKIKRACEITDEVLKELVSHIKVGVSEKEIARMFEYLVKERGCDLSFETIVAVNKNSAIPHYNTALGNSVVENNSVVLIDCGMRYEQYVSDITRVFFVGAPTKEMVADYEALLSAQKKTLKFLEKNRNSKEVDAFCRKEIGEQFPEYSHGTGHGIGLDIHEAPRISPAVEYIIEDGYVVTIEPGIYREGKWGMRIEDTVALVDGRIEILTHFPKTLTIL